MQMLYATFLSFGKLPSINALRESSQIYSQLRFIRRSLFFIFRSCLRAQVALFHLGFMVVRVFPAFSLNGVVITFLTIFLSPAQRLNKSQARKIFHL